MFGNIDTAMVLAVLPEILLLVLAALLMLLDLLWDEERRRFLGWVSAGGLVLILVVSLALSRPGDESVSVWGGMLRDDWLSFVFKMLFIFGAAVTSLFAMEMKALGRRGEFYLLLLVSTIGMSLMASAGDLIMLYRNHFSPFVYFGRLLQNG